MEKSIMIGVAYADLIVAHILNAFPVIITLIVVGIGAMIAFDRHKPP